MIDDEVIKVLRKCGLGTGSALEHHSGAVDIIADRFIELLQENDRQKAEIERLSDCCAGMQNERDAYKDIVNEAVEEAGYEAIKKFTERLKEETKKQRAEYCRVMRENHPEGSALWEFWHGKKTEAEQTLNRIDDLIVCR